MKLMSMTEFVLEQNKLPFYYYDALWTKVINYANFLKQPLELWMFVPCDEDGSVLNIPNKADFEIGVNQKCSGWKYLENENGITTYYDSVSFDNYRSKYQQAKERCLFEGFEAGFKIEEVSCFSVDKLVFSEEEVIENLLQYKIIFTLTPTAIKQIGL